MKSPFKPGKVPVAKARKALSHWGKLSQSLGLAVSVALLFASCIDRSNPFDPINTSPVAASDIRAANAAQLNNLLAVVSGFGVYLNAYSNRYAADSAVNAASSQRNAATRTTNQATVNRNDSIELKNAKQPIPDSLHEKSNQALLDTLAAYGPYDDLDSHLSELQLQSARVADFLTNVNARNAPLVVYPAALVTSTLLPFVQDSIAFVAWRQKGISANAAVAEANVSMRIYNSVRDSSNDSVLAYNELIRYRRSTQIRPMITSADSLKSGTASANAGDTLNLGSGSFSVDLRFGHSGTAQNPIVMRGYPGMSTVLRAGVTNAGVVNGSVMVISAQSNIRFEGIVFRGAGVSAVKLESGSGNVVFRNCRFDSSGLWGLEVVDSQVDMQDCLIVSNGGGIRATAVPTSGLQIQLVNVLVAWNKGNGLETVSPLGNITNCTFANNAGDGIRVISPLRTITIANTICYANVGNGLFREATTSNQDGFNVTQSDVFGNVAGDWNLANMDTTRVNSLVKSNLNDDPQFIDPQSLNYEVMAGSKLDTYAKTGPFPIVIGYRPK